MANQTPSLSVRSIIGKGIIFGASSFLIYHTAETMIKNKNLTNKDWVIGFVTILVGTLSISQMVTITKIEKGLLQKEQI
jgi:hypothetical protein